MNKMGYLIGVILVALMVNTLAHGQCRTIYRGSSYHASSYVAPTYHAPAYVAPTYHAPAYVAPAKEYVYQAVIPVFQLEVRRYNTFGAVYTPPVPEPAAPGAAPTAAPSSDLKQILDAIGGIKTSLSGLEGRIKALEDGRGNPKPADPFNPSKGEPAPAPKQDVKLPDVHFVAQNKCAVCHDAKLGDDAAENIIVTKDNRVADMSAQVRSQVLVKLAKGRSCSGAAKRGIAPVTAEEYTAFVLYLEQVGKKDDEKRGKTNKRDF